MKDDDPDEAIAQRAVALAEQLLQMALARQRPGEVAQARRVAALIGDPAAKGLSLTMTDRLLRSATPRRAAQAWRDLLARFGLPPGFGRMDRLFLRGGALASKFMPSWVMAAVRRRLRRESRSVILPANPAPLARYLAQRRADGARVNVNYLGEAVLGEEEAGRRLEAVLALLERPDVSHVSVKISAIFSQIQLLAWDDTVAAIGSRLRRIYRAAMKDQKWVNLDMEEYRDLELTLTVFRSVLDEAEFRSLSAGVALQAYLPDSWDALQRLTKWAQRRVEQGGAPIRIRLVKGANLAMEKVEAELHGWPCAPYESKAETDANFRRMLDFACLPEHAAAVRVGVGSHNLFDVALALVLRETRELGAAVEIEMLEGMANHQARAVQETAGSVLLYAPIVREQDFGSALAYLIRRLDENTAPENFLHDLFSLRPGSPAWDAQRARFLRGWQERGMAGASSHRAMAKVPAGEFFNEPDTDWTQSAQRAQFWATANPLRAGDSPAPSDAADLSAALDRARFAQPGWEKLGDSARAAVLRKAAAVMAAHRFETIAVMREDGQKAIPEADAEVSEAVDFARYYAMTGSLPAGEAGGALGTVVVASPWNFPFAIPCGGVLAALMAGNAVILKPARETLRTGWWLARQLWEAGVPRNVLQCLSCADGEAGRALIADTRTSAVILTGAYETARMFLDWRPALRLLAETSGKNAMVISALADRELAIKDLVRSAFGHSGQKCSAASLGILEAEVYDDPVFRRQLRDAAASLRCGPASDPASVVTPLLREPGVDLRRALTTLERDESWLLEPQELAPGRWSPGIKLGVRAGSWFHQTECFGPVLGLMRARDLDQAIEFQNGVAYGLTAGLHSLDEKEIAAWREQVQAGNLYINRGTTGAIVRRQPFGGWKRSSVGPGAKAGGPNYVQLFRRWPRPAHYEGAADCYRAAWAEHFSIEHDPSGLRCESNVFRYRPCRGVILRLAEPDPIAEELAQLAAQLTGAPLHVSRATEESDTDLIARLPERAQTAEFLRTLSPPSDDLLRAAYAAGLNWIDAPLAATGRLELTRWLREQAISETRHRYGNPM